MSVTYDRNSFIIDDKRVFLTSGSIHYFRVPRALWRDRLEQAKAAGLNTVQFYVAWNWHEYRPGEFDFTGERDIDHFMTLAEELGLYLVARPGPYICAEWDFGGFPPWLMKSAGIQLRRYDPVYLQYVDRYFAQVLPIIANHQVGRPELSGRGGGVIMVQAENELNLVAKEDGALYMRHLVALYRRLGITVPINTCEGGAEGTIECVNAHAPADRFADYRKRQPDAPLHCTEFWPGWYCTWDRAVEQHPRNPAVVERETWRVLAHGGAGYNYYMWHGGTNFGYTSMYLNTTSYDFTAPLSEAGGVWEKYRRCRRVALFAQTFADILTSARQGDFTDIERDTTLGVNFFQRVSERGKILFVENPNPTRAGVYLHINGISQDLFVPGEAVRTVAYDAPIGAGATLALCSAGVLGRWTHENETLLVAYGEPGVTNRALVAFWVPSETEPTVQGDLAAEWREREAPGAPSAARDEALQDKALIEELERLAALDDSVDLLEQIRALEEAAASAEATEAPEEGAERRPLPAPPTPGGILKFTLAFSETPQMATFTVAGHTYRLLALSSDLADRCWWATEGERIPTLHIGAQRARFTSDGAALLGLNEGDRRIWHCRAGEWPSERVFANIRLPDPPALGAWERCSGEIESAEDYDDSQAVGMFAPTNRVLLDAQAGYAWYRTAFESEAEGNATLIFTGFADRILVYLNGRFVTKTSPPAEERMADPSLDIDVRLRAGRNVLAVLTDNLGHVKGEWQFRGRPMAQDRKGLFGDVLLNYSRRLNGWRFLPGLTPERGADGRADITIGIGIAPAVEGWDWQPPADARSGAPSEEENRLSWYRSAFQMSKEELAFPGRELRLDVTGMGKGVFWVNGRNLGRYWTEKGQVLYYVPKCWLREENTLLLFEEEGLPPTAVRLVWDEKARVVAWQTVQENV